MRNVSSKLAEPVLANLAELGSSGLYLGGWNTHVGIINHKVITSSADSVSNDNAREPDVTTPITASPSTKRPRAVSKSSCVQQN